MSKIIVCDAIHQSGFEILSKESDIEVVDASKTPKDELLTILGDADIAITRSSTAVNEAFLEAGKNLKAIVRAGVGVDNVDIDGCSKRGIILMNVPTANTIAAVEMTMCHLLNAARKYVDSCNDLKLNRTWKREKWYGTELFGKTLGIIGFGNIGSRVGVRAKAFGMDVVAYDPYIEPLKATDLGVKFTSNFEDILKCDFITIHTPKTKETTDIISTHEIEKMKDGVRLVNCARGGLINEEALLEALKTKKVAYAGIDVFVNEPATSHPLLDLDNLVATPHLGANTLESQQNIATQAAEQAISASRGINYPNALNLPIKTDNIPKEVQLYLELVSKMAYLAAQINKAPIKAIRVEINGKMMEYSDSALTFAIYGGLKERFGDSINYVNAKFLADERGIKTEIIKSKDANYKDQISVNILTDKEVSSVSGTIFGDEEARIVNISGFKTDFKPKGKMILLKNKDIPGFIMDISSILAKANVNIADFRLGRNKDGFALAVILIDESIDKEILKQLNEVEACVWAKYATL
ncbi:alpha-ketoglutarate reductase / D-3-phosphoglycerate dehydrogenase [Campylobacter blaseri]|uniref:D-3-phosphoglycerate dehydrogenase n=1 Tax=Campylobacter blaseri TaxID=2042961 RepID=A0A2P8R0A7_9BACT|nr:phosphoglycerate dehydrogenase [Campylobacter blaseri]PSM51931.1 phosphoglycerate dehydrogenase [Campylobacter blaseri]PSM53715.1 phosphoglycerate dehydrogenase [Campylobacter blaseri]QKF85731.1 alpha-ketoglutarate reductase / D-3-phosphoglycerate dehydrogenase [Campylobacter blaseri]